MKYSIRDLADGRCALKNDGTDEELQLVLDIAFPKDKNKVSAWNTPIGDVEVITFQKSNEGEWVQIYKNTDYTPELPMQSCSVFLEEIEKGIDWTVKPECENSLGLNEEPKLIREFETGSKRDDDSDKPLVNHLDPYLRLRFGYLLRQGANKYDKGNWKKGQPTETALESLHRHLAKYELNLQNGVEQDEDHLSAVIFNVMLILKNEEKGGIEANHYYGTLK